jgi:hypothetical protein
VREPDQIIGGKERPYMLRWWVIPRNRFFNIYLHHFLRSDDDRALHDHPWWNLSILLRGRYLEHTRDRIRLRHAGCMVLRRATCAHRIELIDGPVWTLFLTGPKIRSWGFHCPQGWRHWRKFTAADDPGAVGQGCD